MAIMKRTINGIEYLYAIIGKKHIFLGRPDDLVNINKKNLVVAINMMEQMAEKTLERYVRDTIDHSLLMNGNEQNNYLKKMELILLKHAKQISKRRFKNE